MQREWADTCVLGCMHPPSPMRVSLERPALLLVLLVIAVLVLW